MLNLIGECHSLSYDALTAHVAIVFTRYMLLAMEQRQNEDQRTLGELFFFLVDEMADITFSRSLGILMDALMASLQEILKLSDEQLTAFTADFEARLPEYLRNALHPKAVVASHMAKQHDKQFKLDAIQYYQDHKDLGVRGCAENLVIGYSTLTKWLKDFRESGDIPVRGSGNYASDEQKEIARLRRELRDAQDALDVLKKAINILGK